MNEAIDSATIDLVGDPLVIEKIIEYAKTKGFRVSTPMPTDSISDALDTVFGVEEAIQVAQVITIVIAAGLPIVAFLADIKLLLGKSETSTAEEPAVVAKYTRGQKRIGKVQKNTDLSTLEY